MRRRTEALKIKACALEKLEGVEEALTSLNRARLTEPDKLDFANSPEGSLRFHDGAQWVTRPWPDLVEVGRLVEALADALKTISRAETRLAELGTPI